MRILTIALLALTLGACGTATSCDKPEPYQASRQGKPLEVPEGLAKPASSGKFDIPNAGSDKPVRGPCGDQPPLRVAEVAPNAVAGDSNAPLPAPPTNAAPGAAVAGGPPALTGSIENDIRETVIAWASAWRTANGAALVSFYSSEFEPPVEGESRAAWAQNRIRLLEQTGPADVRFDRLIVTESFNGASARFIQEFHNGGQIDALVKRLEFEVEDGRWMIVRERVIEVL